MSYIAKRKFAVALALLIGAGLVVPSARADKPEKGKPQSWETVRPRSPWSPR